MPPFTWRSRLDFRRRSSAPEQPPEGTERFWVNASGALRQIDDAGNDSAAGGDASGAIATHEAASNPHPTYETSAEAQAKVDAAVAALVNSAPAALNTLKELSDALGADANFATTITTAIAAATRAGYVH